MAEKYPETSQTFNALIHLRAESKYVSFKDILNEVKRNRLANNLKENPVNLIGRIRRSLVYNKKTLRLKEMIKVRNEDSQAKLVSIATQFPKYRILSKTSILIKEDGNVQDINDVEENSFKLVKKEK